MAFSLAGKHPTPDRLSLSVVAPVSAPHLYLRPYQVTQLLNIVYESVHLDIY